MSLVSAVVVTYQPEPDLLYQVLASCLKQVSDLVVVDNGSDELRLSIIRGWQASSEIGCFDLLELGDNFGVATAQNKGVAWAKKHACNFVLLLDQDSIPDAAMVVALQGGLADLSARGVSVAAVGPRLVDRRTGNSSPFVEISWFGISRKSCSKNTERMLLTDFLVSSGMLVPISVFEQVGLPEEGLFIDNVDMEWCFRARSKGFFLYGVCDAVMQHSVGDQVFRIGPATLHRHNPLRQYYIMRNRLALYRRSYTPIGWIVQDAWRAVFKLVVFSLIFPPRRENIKMMWRGIRDAYAGRLGRYER